MCSHSIFIIWTELEFVVSILRLEERYWFQASSGSLFRFRTIFTFLNKFVDLHACTNGFVLRVLGTCDTEPGGIGIPPWFGPEFPGLWTWKTGQVARGPAQGKKQNKEWLKNR